MKDRIKEHDRDIRLAHTQTSAVSERANKTGHFPLWNQVKFIDRDPHRYTRRVKEAIHIRLHSTNINRDSGIEIPESMDTYDQKSIAAVQLKGGPMREHHLLVGIIMRIEMHQSQRTNVHK